MRVVGGKCKGRKLASFKGMSIRPTSDKVREAVYNILPREFTFKKVLDLFAGTGAMGIEALSRGAEDATFIDSDPKAVSVVKKNLEACGLAATVLKRDAIEAVRFFSKRGEKFDLVFIDPPYNSALVEKALKAIDKEGVLARGGVIVAETSRRTPIAAEFENLDLFDERKYGDTLIYFFIFNLKTPG